MVYPVMQEKYQLNSGSRRYRDRSISDCQCKCWDSVSNGYRKWWKQIEGNGNEGEAEGAQKVNLRLLEQVENRPGQTVLDIATVYGEPAVSEDQSVGSQ